MHTIYGVLSAIQLVPLLQTASLFITSIQIHPQTSAHMSTRRKKKKKPVLHSNPNTELRTHAHKEERVKQSLAYAVHTSVRLKLFWLLNKRRTQTVHKLHFIELDLIFN